MKVAEAIEVGKIARVEIDGEWFGATVVQVETEEGKTNWYSARLEEHTPMAPKGVILSGLHDTDYIDSDGDKVPFDIRFGKAMVMRADRGELGTDTTSIGIGYTFAEAVEDALEHFKTDTAHFTETPEALKDIIANGGWRSADSKVTYYFQF